MLQNNKKHLNFIRVPIFFWGKKSPNGIIYPKAVGEFIVDKINKGNISLTGVLPYEEKYNIGTISDGLVFGKTIIANINPKDNMPKDIIKPFYNGKFAFTAVLIMEKDYKPEETIFLQKIEDVSCVYMYLK